MKTKSTPNQIKAKLGLHGVSDPASGNALMAADKTISCQDKAISWRTRLFPGGQGYFLEDKAISWRTRLFPGGQGYFLADKVIFWKKSMAQCSFGLAARSMALEGASGSSILSRPIIEMISSVKVGY